MSEVSKLVQSLAVDITKYVLESGDKVKPDEILEAFKLHSKASVSRALTHATKKGQLNGRRSENCQWYYHDEIAVKINLEFDERREALRIANNKRNNKKTIEAQQAKRKTEKSFLSSGSIASRVLEKCAHMKTSNLSCSKQHHYKYIG